METSCYVVHCFALPATVWLCPTGLAVFCRLGLAAFGQWARWGEFLFGKWKQTKLKHAQDRQAALDGQREHTRGGEDKTRNQWGTVTDTCRYLEASLSSVSLQDHKQNWPLPHIQSWTWMDSAPLQTQATILFPWKQQYTSLRALLNVHTKSKKCHGILNP